LFLARLANESKLTEFHRTFDGNQYLTNLSRKGISVNTFCRRGEFLTREYLAEAGLEDLKKRLNEIFLENKFAIIPSGIMDNHFFDLASVSPKELFKWKKIPNSAWERETSARRKVALHFRGRDFQDWEPKAVLSPDYYLNSLEHVLIDNETSVILFTDDPSHEVVTALKKKIPRLSVQSGSPMVDFYSMSICDVLISSPSSFCFWGAALGETKLIIHSKKWLDFKCEAGDYFWAGLRANKFLGYEISQEI
jgi:REP element-mobilizing transposase RayT